MDSNFIFKALRWLTWIAFIGLCIEAGALLFNYVYSWFRPVAIHNLYSGLDLHEVYEKGVHHYHFVMLSVVIITAIKASLIYQLIKILEILDLKMPFNMEVASKVNDVGISLLGIAVAGEVLSRYGKWLTQRGVNISDAPEFWGSSDVYLFAGFIVLVVSHIFKRGVEIQQENELTI